MFKIILIALCFFSSLALAGDNIVASIRPLQSIIANIVDTSKEIDLIVDQNESLHNYHLKPNKVISLTKADLIFVIDKDFEIFLSNILNKLSKNSELVEVAKFPNIKLIESKGTCNHAHDVEEDDHNHALHYDYHLWLDIDNVKAIAVGVTNILSKKYPEFSSLYKKNLEIFIKKLELLDSRVRAKMLLTQKKNFIVTHDAYSYFIKRYGLNQPQSLTIDHDHNIGARDLLSIQSEIESNNVVCVFEEPQFNSQITRKIQQETNVRIGKLDAEWGEDNIPIKEVYFNMMESLADNFVKCLR